MRIGEIAEQTNIPESTLRYYEKKGLLRVERDAKGIRVYAEGDVEWVKFLRRLKATGMPLKDMAVYARLRYEGVCTMPERLQMLEVHRAYVLAEQKKWREYLQNLDEKIAFYKESIER